MSVLLDCVMAFAFFSVGGYAGVLIYAYRVRIRLAWDALRGHIRHDGKALSCAREHVEGGYRLVKNGDYEALIAAADELKVARGFIGAFERDKHTYAEVVNEVVAPSLKIGK